MSGMDRLTFNEWFTSLEKGRQAVLRDDKWMLADAAFQAGRASQAAPAPSDGLREALEECDCCVDGLQADGETPCPYCTKPKVPIADAAEALLEAHKSGAWPVGHGRTLQQVATIIDALRALRRAAPTEGEA